MSGIKENWKVKRFKQTKREQPHEVEARSFSSFEEAEKFYKANKRADGWPWSFWAYPEKAA
jgi:hypothetical protein